jgi:hypothetical protein
MKKFIAIACGAAFLHVCSLAFAQNQEIASVKYSSVKKTEKADNIHTPPTKEAVIANEEGTTDVAKIESSNFDHARASYEMRKDHKKFDINNKVGPNGEEIFLKGSKYYYLNDKGKKVKVKNAQLKDKPKYR